MLNLAFGAADALLDLILVPLDAFELRGGLCCSARWTTLIFALELGEAFARALALLAERDFLTLHVFELGADGFHRVLLLHELEFERFDFGAELAHLGLQDAGWRSLLPCWLRR